MVAGGRGGEGRLHAPPAEAQRRAPTPSMDNSLSASPPACLSLVGIQECDATLKSRVVSSSFSSLFPLHTALGVLTVKLSSPCLRRLPHRPSYRSLRQSINTSYTERTPTPLQRPSAAHTPPITANHRVTSHHHRLHAPPPTNASTFIFTSTCPPSRHPPLPSASTCQLSLSTSVS